MTVRIQNLWVLFRPSEQIAGEWIAHCLELDVVTQGTSLRHAGEMIMEAVKMVLDEDLRAKLDPFRRRERTPQEAWDELEALLHGGSLDVMETIERFPTSSPTDPEQTLVVATQLEVRWPENQLPILRAKAELGLSTHAG